MPLRPAITTARVYDFKTEELPVPGTVLKKRKPKRKSRAGTWMESNMNISALSSSLAAANGPGATGGATE